MFRGEAVLSGLIAFLDGFPGGLRSGISGGSPYIFPQDFGFIGQNAIFGVSWVFVLVCLILLATGYMFSYTVFGRYMLATGGNENAARLCSIATDAIVFRAHDRIREIVGESKRKSS
jgi:ribose/xylose/arabinose/galactoside ABC-type transport system permease subunit